MTKTKKNWKVKPKTKTKPGCEFGSLAKFFANSLFVISDPNKTIPNSFWGLKTNACINNFFNSDNAICNFVGRLCDDEDELELVWETRFSEAGWHMVRPTSRRMTQASFWEAMILIVWYTCFFGTKFWLKKFGKKISNNLVKSWKNWNTWRILIWDWKMNRNEMC